MEIPGDLHAMAGLPIFPSICGLAWHWWHYLIFEGWLGTDGITWYCSISSRSLLIANRRSSFLACSSCGMQLNFIFQYTLNCPYTLHTNLKFGSLVILFQICPNCLLTWISVDHCLPSTKFKDFLRLIDQIQYLWPVSVLRSQLLTLPPLQPVSSWTLSCDEHNEGKWSTIWLNMYKLVRHTNSPLSLPCWETSWTAILGTTFFFWMWNTDV